MVQGAGALICCRVDAARTLEWVDTVCNHCSLARRPRLEIRSDSAGLHGRPDRLGPGVHAIAQALRIVNSSHAHAALAAPPRPTADACAARAVPAPQPILIGAAGHTCLGWWHAPATPAGAWAALPLSVVLAGSWGDEDMAGYDDQRALAVALAQGGLGTLRFEWPDTGDSSAATGATTIADALGAFDAAAREALARSGQERLAFVGVRLGALLASHAAVARQDVDALVALAPVDSGRAFVLEQGASAAAPVAWSAPAEPGVLIDPAELPVAVGGFALSARRVEALSALRWPAAATTAVLEALVLRPPQSAGRVAADALARMGVRVREQARGTPAGAAGIAEVVGWLRERAADATVMRGVHAVEGFGVADPGNERVHARLAAARLESATKAVLALAVADAPTWMRLQEQGVAVRERVIRIGDGDEPTLVGVLSERDPVDAPHALHPPRHGILLLPSDGQRRVGPHRLWVPWARHRAACGDVVLRLDIAGAGDSAAPASARDDSADARGVGDVARALAWLRCEAGVGACTIVGIGAGARQAWRLALADVGVRQAIAIEPAWRGNPVAPAAAMSRAHRVLRGCARAATRWVRGAVGDDLVDALGRGDARGVKMDLVLAGRQGHERMCTGRRWERLLREGRLAVCRVAQAHPDFTSPSDRDALYARLDALVQAGAAIGQAMPRGRAMARRVDGRSSPASQARSVIARVSRSAT